MTVQPKLEPIDMMPKVAWTSPDGQWAIPEPGSSVEVSGPMFRIYDDHNDENCIWCWDLD